MMLLIKILFGRVSSDIPHIGRTPWIWACAAFCSLIAGPAWAQQSDADANASEAARIDEVIVTTGTRRQDRTVLESIAPIDVLSNADLQSTGYTETNRILADLLPSFNFPLPSITDGTDHVRPATLRGLSPDQTLVLINGKRRHTTALLNINGSVGRGSSAVDLNSIPPGMIQRIEVLRDGAAAQYGSDAIAGVINVVLKSASSGGQADLTYGKYFTQLPDVPEPGTVTANDDPDNPGTMIPVVATGDDIDREDGDTVTLNANVGLPLSDSGFAHLGLQWRQRDPTNRAGRDTRRQYPLQTDGTLDPKELTFDRINHRFGNSEIEDLALFYNAGYQLQENLEIYSFGSYATRDGVSTGFYRRASDSRNVPALYPDGFLPEIATDIKDLSLSLGVRLAYAGWDLDLSVLHGENKLDYMVQNSLNTSYGADSQTEFDAGGLRFAQQVFNFDAYRLLEVGFLDAPLSLAFGLEHRREDYTIDAGEEASWETQLDGNGMPVAAGGSQVFPGFRPTNEGSEDRSSTGAYLEVDADLLPNAVLNLILAARFEDYSDFGSTFNVKVAARSQLTSAFSLRGTASTGFRAPSMAQVFFNTTSTNFINVGGVTTPFEIGTFSVGHPVARALGAEDLEPEESVNLSLGAVLQLADGISVTLDFYRITIDDRTVLSETLREANATGLAQLLADAGITGTDSARFFINGVDTTNQGFDLVATWDMDLTLGDLQLSAAFNWNDVEVDEVRENLQPFGDTELNLFGRREQARFELGTPETKLNLSAAWDLDFLSLTLRATRYGETVDPANDEENDEVLSPKWVVDLAGTYKGPYQTQFTLGINNVLDEYPDTTPPTSTFNRIFPFSGFSPFGFNGRYVYLRAGVAF